MGEDHGLVLVVDDNEMNRDMLARRLKRQNLDVELAENGQRALDLIRQKAFDLILLDVMMPQMNGYEVLEYLKGQDAYRSIPVIMISAVDDLDSVVKCIEMGAEDYLFKPFNPVLLKARVSASLDKKRLRDQMTGGAVAALQTLLEELSDMKLTVNQLVAGSAGVLNDAQAQLVEALDASVERMTLRLAELGIR